MFARVLVPFILSSFLAACGGSDAGVEGETEGYTPEKVSKSILSVNARNVINTDVCPNGGIEVDLGVDDNGNGLLESSEVDETKLVCHGQNGTDGKDGNSGQDGASSLIDLVPLDSSDKCPLAAVQINVGIDLNNNQQLDLEEIQASEVICSNESLQNAKEFSGTGIISGKIPTSFISEKDFKSQSSVGANKLRRLDLTDQRGDLWIKPSDVIGAITADKDATERAAEETEDDELSAPVVEAIQVVVDENGNYQVEVPAGTDYKVLLITGDGASGVQIDDVSVSPDLTTEVNIESDDLVTTGSASLTVQSLQTGEYLQGASISLFGGGFDLVTDSSGQALLEGLPPGDYRVLVQLDGYVSVNQGFSITSDNQTDIGIIELNSERGNATGQVIAEDLDSMVNVVVYARGIDGSIYTTLTDDAGNYQFSGLPVGQGYSFIAHANDFNANKQDNVEIRQGESTTINPISLSRVESNFASGSITGYAKFSEYSQQQDQHAGILVAVEGTDKEGVTSRDGAFVINGLAPGEYVVNFTDSNHDTISIKNVKVVDSSTTNLDIEVLEPKSGLIAGTVLLEQNSDHAGIKVALNGTNQSTITDGAGNWFLSVPMGNYPQGLTYSKANYQSITNTSTITVTEFGQYTAATAELEQISAELLVPEISTDGNCGRVFIDVSNHGKNYSATFELDSAATLPNIPIGEVQAQIYCQDPGWENIYITVNLATGTNQVTLDAIHLRQSYIVINQGAEFTNTNNVTLEIGNELATQMNITDGSTSTGWIDYASTVDFDLSGADGIKTVSVDFREFDGSSLPSVQDSIELDTTLTIKSITASGATTKGDTLLVSVDLDGEVGAQVSAELTGIIDYLPLNDSGLFGDELANDGVYQREFVIGTTSDVNTEIVINATDKANNTDSQLGNLVTINTAPDISVISVNSNVSTGLMTIEFTTNELATSTIKYGTDANSLDNESSVSDGLSFGHSITLTDLAVDTITYFEVLATDAASNTATKLGRGKLAPEIVTGVSAAAGVNEVGVVWNSASSEDVAGYRVYRSTDGGTSYTLVNPNTLITNSSYLDSDAVNDTSYHYIVTALDIDLNESIKSDPASAIPSATLAGPTELDGGIIETNTVWLGSRSPYQITANLKVYSDAQLTVLAGTEVVINDGVIFELNGGFDIVGEPGNRVSIKGDQPDIRRTDVPHGSFSYLDLEVKGLSGRFDLNNVNVSGSIVADNFINGVITGQALIKYLVKDSEITNGNLDVVGLLVDSTANNATIQGNSEIRNLTAVDTRIDAGLIRDSLISYSVDGINSHIYSPRIENSNLSDVGYLNAEVINDSTITGTTVFTNKVRNNHFAVEYIHISELARLNNFDNVERFNEYCEDDVDLGANYWGTSDYDEVLALTHCHRVFPVLISSELKQSDSDQDGVFDWLDADTDNDGYSDLQEFELSDLTFGVSYNPLDSDSKPSVAFDNDVDGIADDVDTDDDNDGLSDDDEVYVYLTNPNLADSDGDGVNDLDDIEPLDNSRFVESGRYQKLDANGLELDDSSLNWSCVKDTETGLIWEVKQNSRTIQGEYWTYPWNSILGDSGFVYEDMSGFPVNAEGYRVAINEIELCGANDWVVPDVQQLSSLIDTNYAPTINPDFFPHTFDLYWTSDTAESNSDEALAIDFASGEEFQINKNTGILLRLVRKAP